jgi:hypothetical protein
MACPCLNDQDDLVAVIEVLVPLTLQPSLRLAAPHPNPHITPHYMRPCNMPGQVSCPINSSFDFAAERALSALSAHTGAAACYRALRVIPRLMRFPASLQRVPYATLYFTLLPQLEKCRLQPSRKW